MQTRVVILLLLSFASAQAVSLTDCACGPLCGHKNACPGHDAAPDDCCKEEPGRTCSHVEPQSDLSADVPSPDLDAAAPLLLEGAPPAPPRPAAFLDVPLRRGLPPPSRGRPLYLSQLDLRL